MAVQKKQLGQVLVDSNKITPAQLEEVLQYKQDHGVYLGQAVVALGLLTEKELVDVLADQLDIPSLDIVNYDIEKEVLKIVDESLARRLKVMPLFSIDNSLTVATSDPLDVEIEDELRNATGMEINLVLSTESAIEQVIDLHYGAEKYLARTEEEGERRGVRVVSKEIGEDTEIIDAMNMLLNEAIKMRASDIHMEPRESEVRIRFRVDGVLQQYYTLPRSSVSPLISRAKILSDMDIAETRKPQDGRFRYSNGDAKIDIRTSTYRTANGEKVVMRLLDESRGRIELHKLGFTEEMLKKWRKVVHLTNGIVLVCGPTGSGKTTTLYATLNVINSVEINIMTIEDPIEYQIDNINQAQVNVKAGITFSEALKSMMRQDPDIIMVGEMRDIPTIELAIRAALTGHLVLSTLHTNDASSAFTRLLDMGVEPYLLSSTVRAIVSQRLIRLLCPRCKVKTEPSEEMLNSVGIQGEFQGTLFQPDGCVYCKNSGYFGRRGIFELLVPNDEITTLVNARERASEIHEAAVRSGMVTLREGALNYVLSGDTSVEEMMRVTTDVQ